jgi:hypothetical protein
MPVQVCTLPLPFGGGFGKMSEHAAGIADKKEI